jgi:hypothetical protein
LIVNFLRVLRKERRAHEGAVEPTHAAEGSGRPVNSE